MSIYKERETKLSYLASVCLPDLGKRD